MKKLQNKRSLAMILSLILCLMTVCFLSSCSSAEEPKEEAPAEPEKIVYTSPITGEESEKEYPARPLVVSVDNVGDAIPQSWLSKADMVYEFPVEGEQTRLQAIFHSEFPEHFGPIRSTRPYFVDLTREYKGIFLAHGWSPQAKEYLMSDVVPYINAMNSSCNFYRVDDKVAPHNSYIKWSEVKDKIKEEGWWDEKQDIRPFQFLAADEEAAGEAATYIEMDYGSAHCEYTYNAEKDWYVRTIDNGEKYIDKETEKSIKAKNVLVQCVSSKVLDSKGRLEIDMCAGGEAMLFTKGKVIKGTWTRENLDSKSVFVDAEGNEFKFSVGNTWVMIADQNLDIDIEAPEAEEADE